MKKIAWFTVPIWGMVIGCAQNGTVELEGKLFVKGSMPHTFLVIEDQKSHRSYKIINAKRFGLFHKQQQIIRIKAKRVKKALGPGFPAEIEVIEIE